MYDTANKDKAPCLQCSTGNHDNRNDCSDNCDARIAYGLGRWDGTQAMGPNTYTIPTVDESFLRASYYRKPLKGLNKYAADRDITPQEAIEAFYGMKILKKKVATSIGVSTAAVSYYYHDYDLEFMPKLERMASTIIKKYKANMPYAEITRSCGIRSEDIQRVLRENNIPGRKAGPRKKRKR